MLTARDAVDPETFEAIFERYSALYAAAPGAANIPFPHVNETLRQLVSLGHRLALCTNKPTAPDGCLLGGACLDGPLWRGGLRGHLGGTEAASQTVTRRGASIGFAPGRLCRG